MNNISAHSKSILFWSLGHSEQNIHLVTLRIPLNLASYAGMNLPPLISRVPASVRESKMSTDEENPGAQYNEAGLEKTGFF